MIQSGVTRVFAQIFAARSPRAQHSLSSLLVGLGVTAALQSSTANGGSCDFAHRPWTVELVPALA